jgi:hypothetical protein
MTEQQAARLLPRIIWLAMFLANRKGVLCVGTFLVERKSLPAGSADAATHSCDLPKHEAALPAAKEPPPRCGGSSFLEQSMERSRERRRRRPDAHSELAAQ